MNKDFTKFSTGLVPDVNDWEDILGDFEKMMDVKVEELIINERVELGSIKREVDLEKKRENSYVTRILEDRETISKLIGAILGGSFGGAAGQEIGGQLGALIGSTGFAGIGALLGHIFSLKFLIAR